MSCTNKKIIRGIALSLMTSVSLTGTAYAAGFALIENGAKGQGNAYAGAAAHAVDASTVYFNPAGMMQLENDSYSITLHYIDPKSDFTNKGSTDSALTGGGPLPGGDDDGGQPAFVPNFFMVKSLGGDAKFGLGVSTTFGLATKYDEDWVGRYHAVESDFKTFNVNPSLAFQLSDKVSVGGGVNVLLGNIILSQAIDFDAVCLAFAGVGAIAAGDCPSGGTPPFHQADGFGELTGDNFKDPSIGFNLGMTYQIDDNARFGLAYRTQIETDFTGDADFTIPSGLSPQFAGLLAGTTLFTDTGIKAGVTLPANLSLSYARTSGKITYLADATWTGWSSFDELRIIYDNNNQPNSVTTEDWDDSWRYSLGLDYQYSDALTLRAGVALDETPIPNAELRTPRIPGNDRTWVSFGLSYKTNKESSFDVGISHLMVDDTDIENTFESGIPTLAHTLIGTYDPSVNIHSVQFNKKF